MSSLHWMSIFKRGCRSSRESRRKSVEKNFKPVRSSAASTEEREETRREFVQPSSASNNRHA